MKKTKKSKKKDNIIILEDPEVCNTYIKPDNSSLIYTKIMAVIFLCLAIGTIVFGIICVIQITEAAQYIPEDVYYPTVLFSFFAIVNMASFATLFFTLFLIGLLDDGTGFDLENDYHHDYYD